MYSPSNFSPDKTKCALQLQVTTKSRNVYFTEETSEIRAAKIKASTPRKEMLCILIAEL